MLDEKKYAVHIYEKNTAVGRKFLVAGDGGFNLTHSEDIDLFVTRYSPQDFLAQALRSFTNTDVCDWLKSIGVETHTGSSKRIFPVKGIKPIDVLNAFLKKIKSKNAYIHTGHEWKGWTADNAVVFSHKGEDVIIHADEKVFALGGASWPITGSNGTWSTIFQEKGINSIPFQSSNCAYQVQWPLGFIDKHEGDWFKNITVTGGGQIKKGELVITAFGLEGGAVYALSPILRQQIDAAGKAEICIDFKPAFSKETLIQKLSGKTSKSLTQVLKIELKLTDTQIALVKASISKEEFLNVELLAAYIKSFPISITGMAPINEAISTVGGIALSAVDSTFQLKQLPDQYVIGEMLDWDAPTGGYLLQGCFSMGAWLADVLNDN